jgi:hypothetical protein
MRARPSRTGAIYTLMTRPYWRRERPDGVADVDLPGFYREQAITNLRCNGVSEYLLSWVIQEFDDAIETAEQNGLNNA